MKLTDQLVTEHGSISLAISILDKIGQNIKAQKSVDREDLIKIIDFLQTFANRCHHGKEETVLFPAMIAADKNLAQGPVSVLVSEHHMARAKVANMARASDNFSSSKKKFAENALEYGQILTQHIKKEDSIAFPLAEKIITSKIKQKSLQKFDKIEEDLIGQGKHEEYHNLLRNLKAKYLSNN